MAVYASATPSGSSWARAGCSVLRAAIARVAQTKKTPVASMNEENVA